tara:strand:+ start:201 stop:806 length:606 start_codon:yes stop_codon:yes gene_type:complete
MDKNEKNRILKLHKKELLQERETPGMGGTNTSSSGQYDGNAFVGEGPLTTSGRERDIGELPQEVDITKGSQGFQFGDPKIAFITGPGDDDDDDIDIGDDDIDIGDITIGDDYEIIDINDMVGPPKLPKLPISAPTKPIPSSEDEINRPLSLSCCKKCDNGMYTNRCFPFDTENDEDCIFPTLEVCEDESEPRLPSMLDIFS